MSYTEDCINIQRGEHVSAISICPTMKTSFDLYCENLLERERERERYIPVYI